VRLATVPGADKDEIQQTLERRVPMADLEFEYIPSIERNANGKRSYFVDAMQDGGRG